MPNLQIRELPADVYQALAADARREHRSLTQQAIVELREAQALRRRSQKPAVLSGLAESSRRFDFAMDSPEDLIRSDRER